MKIENFHAYGIRKLKLITPLFLGAIVLLVISSNSYTKASIEKELLKNDINASKQNLDNLEFGVMNSEEATKIWNDGLNIKYSNRQGIQIENAKRRLDLIKSTFNIIDLKVSLNTPQKVESVTNLVFLDVMYSKIVLDFNAYTDADAIRFLDAVSRQLPGILLTQELKINAPDNIRTSLNQALSKGSLKDLTDTVKVNVTINWFDFIDKSSSKDVTNSNSLANNPVQNLSNVELQG